MSDALSEIATSSTDLFPVQLQLAICFMLFGFFGTIISTSVFLRWKQQPPQTTVSSQPPSPPPIMTNHQCQQYYQYPQQQSSHHYYGNIYKMNQYIMQHNNYYLKRNCLLQPQHSNTQIILDWDDTLFPTSFTLLAMKNGQKYSSLIEEQTWRQLQALNTAVIQLLLLLIQMFGTSNVCIVTNAKMSWWNESCLMYKQKFVGVRDLIVNAYKIQVVSAYDSYSRKKSSAFMDLIGRKAQIDRVVSIGDSMDEYEAVHSVCSVLRVTAKRPVSYYRFKLLENPSLNAMTKQLNAISALDFHQIASQRFDESYQFK